MTVSTSNSCRCPLQLFILAHWAAMRCWSLVRLNNGLERSVEPPLASMCSVDKEKVFPRIDNAETSASRETTRSPARRFAARSLLVSCPPGTMVSSYRRSSLSLDLLAANSCGCLFGKAAHSLVSCPSGACLNRSLLRAMSRQVPAATSPQGSHMLCIRCRCLTDWCSPALLLPSVTRKVNCSRSLKKVTANISSTFSGFCTLQGSTDSVCGLSTSSALVSHVHLYMRARWPAPSIDVGVQRRETADNVAEQTNRQTTDTTVL